MISYHNMLWKKSHLHAQWEYTITGLLIICMRHFWGHHWAFLNFEYIWHDKKEFWIGNENRFNNKLKKFGIKTCCCMVKKKSDGASVIRYISRRNNKL